MSDDANTTQSEEFEEFHLPLANDADVEQLLEMMLETEAPMPEEAGYGHGV